MNGIDAKLPMTVICSKAVEDITETLEKVQHEHNISSDLMCMICRDLMGHFERKRANEYCNAIINQTAKIDVLEREMQALKQMNDIFKGGENDHTKT